MSTAYEIIKDDKEYLELLGELRILQHESKLLNNNGNQRRMDYLGTSLLRYDLEYKIGLNRGEYSKYMPSGKRYWFEDPWPEDIDIKDISYCISRICRFGGGTNQFYSVAQHSYHVSELVPEEIALEALLHDASEAYLGDVVTPLKKILGEKYRELESKAQLAIHAAFGIESNEKSEKDIKYADNIMLLSESYDLTTTKFLLEYVDAALVEYRITPWSIEQTNEKFLERFRELYGQKQNREKSV